MARVARKRKNVVGGERGQYHRMKTFPLLVTKLNVEPHIENTTVLRGKREKRRGAKKKEIATKPRDELQFVMSNT